MTQSKPEPMLSWKDRLFEPVDAASVVFFRVAFGFMMLCHVVDLFDPGKLERYYLTPMLFKYYGFSWLQPWSLTGLKIHCVVLILACLGIMLGFFYRLSAAVFCLGFLYLFLLDKAGYDNHDYLIALLAALLVVVPAHRAGSLDALRNKSLRSETIPAWGLRILQFQIAVPYVFGGIAKLNYDWLVRGEPIGMWLRSVDGAEGSFDMAWFRESWSGHAFAWGGLVFDLAIVPLLLWRRTRIPAFLAAVGFHLSNSQMFNIGVFPWLMIAATTIYFEPDWPRRLGLLGRQQKPSKRQGKGSKRAKASSASPAVGGGETIVSPTLRAWTWWLLVIWIGVQVLLPFRHYLYPGNVDWTEEGHRFAWRMKLRHKEGQVYFAVVNKATQQTQLFKDFTGVLTHRQQRHLFHDPDMIHQFAQRLAKQLEENGQPNVEVRALTQIALNGRKPAPYIDPKVDLASEPRTLKRVSWLLPFDHEGTLPD